MKTTFDLFNEVHIRHDSISGCTFVIALNARDGARCSGGTRMKIYSSLDAGVADAVQLTRGMSKKCIIIGNEFNGGFSGGKGVIIGDPDLQKTPEMLARYGEFVNSLNGVFVTGTDLNIIDVDAQHMAKVSPNIDGLSIGPIDDTAVGTAYGLLYSIRKAAALYFKKNSLTDMKVCVQGLGSVGMRLIGILSKEGAKVVATDISTKKREKAKDQFKVETVLPEDIYNIDCDVFSPNAVGGIINEANITRLSCKCIIGSANNQLDLQENALLCHDDARKHSRADLGIEKDELGYLDRLLKDRSIVYLPEYVVGVGGVYTSICEQMGNGKSYMLSTLDDILSRQINHIYHLSMANDSSFLIAAEQYIDSQLT